MSNQDNFNLESGLASQVQMIDQTLEMRVQEMDDAQAGSYTLNLLRDPNEAGKKFGQEVIEYNSAVVGAEAVEDCEEELADLIYSGLVLALSREKSVRLSNVLGILIARNAAGQADLQSLVGDIVTKSE